MITRWRDILVGFLAERANSVTPTFITHPEAVFISRLLDGSYLFPNTQEFTALLEKMERRGFAEYAASYYRRFLRVVDGDEYEISLTAEGALALLQMASDPVALGNACRTEPETQ
jgi:hypothetical protein